MDTCEACKMWQRHNPGRTDGQCRAMPPMVVPTMTGQETVWPTTQSTDWCGAFKAAKKGK